MVGESTEAVGAGVGGGSSGNKMPTLEEYGTNLTKLAEEVVYPNLSFCLCICELLYIYIYISFIGLFLIPFSWFYRVNWILLLEGSSK